MPGVDGRKMSKSYNNTIEIFDDPATIRKKCKKIVTDSTPVEAPKNPDTCPLFGLFQLFAAGRRAGRGRAAVSRGGHRLRRDEDPAGRGDHRRLRRGPRARAEWVAHPSAWPKSGPPPPSGPGRPPGSSSTGPARRAGSIDGGSPAISPSRSGLTERRKGRKVPARLAFTSSIGRAGRRSARLISSGRVDGDDNDNQTGGDRSVAFDLI